MQTYYNTKITTKTNLVENSYCYNSHIDLIDQRSDKSDIRDLRDQILETKEIRYMRTERSDKPTVLADKIQSNDSELLFLPT